MKLIESIFQNLSALLGVAMLLLLMNYYGKLFFSRTKSGKAKVIRKDCYEKQTVSKHPMNFSETVYEVVFLCENKELLFQVSEFSYGNYRVGQTGTLKWKGRKLLDFS
ncbi:MAG: DUF2500 domain-containing protein [Ruminococcaceae bacterium]|nr:DUF2500 domain-containing protein [Oscillospiraceae bacterium]